MGPLGRAARLRPLSPHLAIHRWFFPTVTSVCHRFTGAYVSALLLSGSVSCLALGSVFPLESTPLLRGLVAVPLVFHALSEVRYLVWDAGLALSLPAIYGGGYALLGATAAASAWLLLGSRTVHSRDRPN